MWNLQLLLKENPIIAACKSDGIEQAVRSPVSIILVMQATISELLDPQFIHLTRKKQILVHIDLVKGITGEREALEYLKEQNPHMGIVSTKGSVIKTARKIGLTTVQRIFLIDTQSLKNSIDALRINKPDAVEVMPGIASSIFKELRQELSCPLIAAGLIKTSSDVQTSLANGAHGISCSNSELWIHPHEIIT